MIFFLINHMDFLLLTYEKSAILRFSLSISVIIHSISSPILNKFFAGEIFFWSSLIRLNGAMYLILVLSSAKAVHNPVILTTLTL